MKIASKQYINNLFFLFLLFLSCFIYINVPAFAATTQAAPLNNNDKVKPLPLPSGSPPNINPPKPAKPVVLRIAVPNLTVSDISLEKSALPGEIIARVKAAISKNPAFSLIDLKKTYQNSQLLTSDESVAIGEQVGTDIIFTGTVAKLEADILVNVRLAETVVGKIVFSKQYFAKQNQTEKLINAIITDLNYFAANLDKFDINVFDAGTGTKEIKVRSTPTNAKVAFNEKELGRTPLILKNVSNAQHLIETWQEETAIIKNFNISAADEKLYELKFENKTYLEAAVKLTNLERDEYPFEIISKPEEKPNGKVRPKLSDISYDTRKFKLEIVTEPDNMPVELDGKAAGASPMTIDQLSQGKHTIKLIKKKLLVFRQIVDTSAKQISEVNFNLFKLGRVLISSTPSNAEIFVNNEKIGVTPKSIELPIGKHYIEIRHEGFKEETYVLNVAEGKTDEVNLNLTSLRNVDTNVSFLPTAVVDNNLGLSAYFLSLGQYSLNDNTKSLAYLYGAEVNYGFKDLLKIGKYLDLGVQAGIFYNKMATFTLSKDFPSNQGIAAKVQFINQGDLIPVSAALGAFYNFNSSVDHKLNLYLAATRDFGFLSVHLGLQVQPFKLSALNLNVNYNRFYRIKLGAAVLINFNLLTNTPQEYLSPLFGVTVGYNFF